MSLTVIDAGTLSKMFLAGAKNLDVKKDWINDLNVFPVPDGDTGTNMTMTIMSAVRELQATDQTNMVSVCKAISSGSLRGARGNSGVILSQLIRGLTKGIGDKTELGVNDLVAAMEKAVETAYKAVMKPKEGTILTVARAGAEKAKELKASGCTSLEEFIPAIITAMDEMLERTPEMLPVLKQAGVVDSGGQGLMQVVKGAYDAYLGKEIDLTFEYVSNGPVQTTSEGANYDAVSSAEITFGYCTEFIIMLDKPFGDKAEKSFKKFLESIGDSIVLVADDEIVKIHVHTNDPGLAIQRALQYGALSNMKIDNMRLEHQEKLFKMSENGAVEKNVPISAAGDTPVADDVPVERKEYGFVAVSAGDGLKEIFISLGCDAVIEGGQTMNPSTEDVLEAIKKVNADHVYVLPNNGNIILAAQQAAILTEDKNVHVIPSKTVPQGISAMLNYMPDVSVDDNIASMTEVLGYVKTGSVTYAVRDTSLDGIDIKEGDYMGVGDKTILASGPDMNSTANEMLEKMDGSEAELITIYYGADITEEAAEKFRSQVEENYPDAEVEMHFGGQPVYYYVISVE